ncbi:uncharacterized protein RCO7_09375 [Rhynchosporium graminicola]|uniref:Large ribosomal subunit protein bL33m n=1 Tax=Rhynchosporium graminicola TaxID=2792576 RepID=A0A1E1KWT1_9HELO|nr:uncharacterized protein RCO7_09375 [Rhynchosporium commune]
MAKKAKSRTIAVRLISMALTGYYKTLVRPRTHRPLSMLKYDPVGTLKKDSSFLASSAVENKVGWAVSGHARLETWELRIAQSDLRARTKVRMDRETKLLLINLRSAMG